MGDEKLQDLVQMLSQRTWGPLSNGRRKPARPGTDAIPNDMGSLMPLPQARKPLTARLCGQVRAELGQVPGSKAWASSQAEGAANLPAFNAYPQPHATAVGEYLMALPQMLEGLGQEDAAPASDAEEGPQGSEWLDRVRPYDAQIAPLWGFCYDPALEHVKPRVARDVQHISRTQSALCLQ